MLKSIALDYQSLQDLQVTDLGDLGCLAVDVCLFVCENEGEENEERQR